MQNSLTHTNWEQENRLYLRGRLEEVRERLSRRLDALREQDVPNLAFDAAPLPGRTPASNSDSGMLPALEKITQEFQLSNFERDLLLLCAGIELDARIAELCAAFHPQGHARLTFAVALDALAEAHWSALLPDAPLRRWRLIECEPGDVLIHRRLRIPERVLHYLLGLASRDELLAGMIRPVPAPEMLSGERLRSAGLMNELWGAPVGGLAGLPAVQLYGSAEADKRSLAAFAAARAGLRLMEMQATAVPAAADEREALARLWEREVVLGGFVLFVEVPEERNPAASVLAFFEDLSVPRILSVPALIPAGNMQRIEVSKPSAMEQREIWRRELSAYPEWQAMNGGADQVLSLITSQFNLGVERIREAGAATVREMRNAPEDNDIGRALWRSCRALARPALEDLAQPIDVRSGWDDLVLPPLQMQMLRDVAVQVKHRARVYEEWGFGNRSNRGLGISALFAGPSGTGKTMAGEVLARELDLDLFRIDLSQVVSKYIGETEKNLRKVFDAAESGGAILLFDEADALFGKRSEVKDSHDRHANIEVSYLLQRMESYRGLAVLTTNLKNSLDTAFLRRIRFVVQFPFPDAGQREEIWRKAFPAAMPLGELNYKRLAQLNVAGGNIKNIAMSAAFLAAEDDAPVNMNHLLQAAKGEYMKLEKTISGTEFRDWGK